MYRKDWGTTCVNYTDEGLILDVFSEESMKCLHTAYIESVDLEVNSDSGGDVRHKFEVLTEAGYYISEDSDQPGLWTWQLASAGDACEASLGSREEAIAEAWIHAGYSDIDDSSPSPTNA